MSNDNAAVLDHPSRQRIYEHLVVLPGNHFRAIVRTLGLSVGVVRHHLAVLVRSGLVHEERTEGRVRYYPLESAIARTKARLYRKHWKYRDLRFRVFLCVHALRSAKPASVASALGISRQLASYHLAALEKKGQVALDDGWYRSR